MKPYVTASLFFLFPFIASAQLVIYNGSFDSVVTQNGNLVPVNWTIPNNDGGEAVPAPDAFMGSHAVRIYNYNFNTPGQLLYGSDDAPNQVGMPVLALPTALSGYYKFLPDDSAGSGPAEVWVYAQLYDQINGETDTVATGHFVFTPSPGYVQFTVPINAGAGATAADTLQIHFTSGNGPCSSTGAGTCNFLYIDELTADFLNGSSIPLMNVAAQLLYNATVNQLEITNWHERMDGWSVKVWDATGRNALEERDVSGPSLRLPDDLPAGIYLYRGTVGAQQISGKFTVQR